MMAYFDHVMNKVSDSMNNDMGRLDGVSEAVLRSVRVDGRSTRGEVSDAVGYGKAAISDRVRRLIDLGLLVEDGQVASGGGRPSGRLHFATDAGYVVAVEIAISHARVVARDLGGGLLRSETLDHPMSLGPDLVLGEVTEAVGRVIDKCAVDDVGNLLGIGVGVAAPVEFATGRTVMPPVHPAWHDQRVRDRLESRFGVPAWVDNEVNAIALAEARLGAAQGIANALVLKVGSFVGAGLISNGVLHRGAQGCAGSLASAAGGDAIARQGSQLARSGASEALAARFAETGEITARDVADAAGRGDRGCVDVLDSAATDIGRTLALVVDVFNPELVIVTGRVAEVGDRFLARIRETVYGCSIALASRDLQIVRSQIGADAATIGAALLAVDQLFNSEELDATVTRLRAPDQPPRSGTS